MRGKILFIIMILCSVIFAMTTKTFADMSAQPVGAAAPNSAGLVARYELEGNAAETSGSQPAANGILVGNPTYEAGPSGQAICFDGDDYVNCGNRSSFNLTKQLTIAAWIKVNKLDKEYQTIISKGDNSWRLARAGKSNSIEFACDGTAIIKWNGKGEVPWAVIGTTNVNDGKWHHIAGVFDSSALYLYIDGVLEAAKSTVNSISISNYDVCIGTNAQIPARNWNGLIDDVRIYDYALSQAEIVGVMGKPEIQLPLPVPATLYNIAERYDKAKKFEEAKGVCQLILQRHPDSSYASNAQLYISKRNILSLIESKKYTEVQPALDKLMADFGNHPDLPEALYAIAGRHSNAKKFKEAESIYREIIQRFPNDQYAIKAKFNAPKIHIFYLIASGNFGEVQTAIDKFVADFLDNPDVPGIIYWFAKELELAKEYEKAKSIYLQVALDYPDNPHSIKAQLGASKIDALLFIESEQDTEAQRTLDNLITNFRDNPDLPDAIFQIADKYYNLAIRHDKEGLEDQTREFYRKAIAIWGKMVQELPPNANYTPRAYYCSAVCYSQELAEHQKGIEYFQKIVDNWPKYRYAWDAQFLIGRSYEALKKAGSLPPSEADAKIQQAYQAVIEKYPDSNDAPYAALKLGQMSFRTGKWSDAAYYFELFLQKNKGQTPNLVFINTLYDLGRDYEQMGELDAAVQTYRSFIEAAEPSDPRIETVKATLEKLEGVKK
jgi:TolA-binding protein